VTRVRPSWSVLLAVAALSAAGPGVAQQPVFRTITDSVTVDVSVQQRGRPVPDLTTRDFEVRDNGQLRPVLDLRSDRQSP
jgi:hypothetical protein